MRPRAIPAALALAALLGAPDARATEGIEPMIGLGVRVPPGAEWVVFERKEGLVFGVGRQHRNPQHSSIALVIAEPHVPPDRQMTADALRQMIREREGERDVEWLELDVRPDSFGVGGLRYHAAWLDRKVPGGKKRPHRVAVEGLFFRHPDAGLAYDVVFSERAPEGVAHEDHAVAQDFLAGLSLHRPAAIPAHHRVVTPLTLSYLHAGRSLWVGRDRELENRKLVVDELVRMDPETFEIRARVDVGNDPGRLVADRGKVWVANMLDGSVMRVDSARMEVEATIPCAKAVSRLAIAGSHVWVSEWGGNAVWRIPRDGDRAEKVRVKGLDRAGPLCFDGRLLWIGDVGNSLLHAIDPVTLAPVGSPVGVGETPSEIVAGSGVIWVLSRGLGAVQKVDVEARRAVATYRLQGRDPRSIALLDGVIYVADFVSGTIERLDTVSGRWIEPPLDVGLGVSCTLGEQEIWVNDWPTYRLSRLTTAAAP